MEEGSQRTRFFTTTTDFQCWHTQNPLVTNLLVSRILRVPWFLFFKGVIEWFIYIFYAWWDWDIYSHCKKAACFWSPYVVNKSLVDIRPSQVFFLPKRRSKLSIPVISALHPGRLTAGSPTNHPFRKNGKWSEPNLHVKLQGCTHLKVNMSPEGDHFKRKIIIRPSFLRRYVSFRGNTWDIFQSDIA